MSEYPRNNAGEREDGEVHEVNKMLDQEAVNVGKAVDAGMHPDDAAAKLGKIARLKAQLLHLMNG